MTRDFKVKKKLFDKLSKSYSELIDQTKMMHLKYIHEIYTDTSLAERLLLKQCYYQVVNILFTCAQI